jgi:predicted O-methyltransferase YrrM
VDRAVADGRPSFEQSWRVAAEIPGWLTTAQARVLWEVAYSSDSQVPIVEIGSHQGRSTLVLAAARPPGQPPVVAIDPFIEHVMLGDATTQQSFERHVSDAGRDSDVRLLVARSGDVLKEWAEPISALFIDGKHDYWTVSDDLRWSEFVVDRGIVMVHDAFSSVGVTLALLRHVLPAGNLRYVDRTASLVRLETSPPTALDRLRLAAQLPWFARNVVIKIALRVARLVGYRGTPDPY